MKNIDRKVYPHIRGGNKLIRFHIGGDLGGYFVKKFIGPYPFSRHNPVVQRLKPKAKSPIAKSALSSWILINFGLKIALALYCLASSFSKLKSKINILFSSKC